ncbi:MAG: stage V sporulation protein G, partial [Thermoguttaceae bacterium]|nr:stage V sporulation protein G [Thermoguttaceae bacterium]
GSNYCSQCGVSLAGFDPCANMTDMSPSKLYVDIVHPINPAARDVIHRAIIDAYEQEKELASRPGYVSDYDNFFQE